MLELINSLVDIVISLSIWTLIFAIYLFLGALFGSWLSKRGRRNSDDLRWIILGIVIFAFGVFPLTYFWFYK